MTSQDVELAEALRARFKDFTQKKEYYNALLDIGAAYRLLIFSQDPRVAEVHQEWILAYQRYEDAKKAAAPVAKTVEQLGNLLKQIGDRRR
jgi:peptide methionine sulfoxide reductase MsrA